MRHFDLVACTNDVITPLRKIGATIPLGYWSITRAEVILWDFIYTKTDTSAMSFHAVLAAEAARNKKSGFVATSEF